MASSGSKTAFFFCCALPGSRSNDLASLQAESPLNEVHWQELKKELDYGELRDEIQPVEISKEYAAPKWTPGPLASWILVVSLLIVMVIVIVRMVGIRRARGNTGSSSPHFSLEHAEDHLDEVDLAPLHEIFVSAGDYRSAVRVLYLQAIQLLIHRGLIDWRKGKTNGDYVREIGRHPLNGIFIELTRVYEKTWFGKSAVHLAAYQRALSQFQQLETRELNG